MLQKVYDKLKARQEKYSRYARPSSLLGKSLLYGFAVLVLVFLAVQFFLEIRAAIYMEIAIIVWALIMYLSTKLLDRKARVYRLNADERVVFHTCSILENLSNYFDAKTSELKEEYKKNVLLHTRKLFLTVENNWTIGKFKLAKKVFGDSISELKGNLRTRLIPAIEKGDENTLRHVNGIIYNLAVFSRNPSISDLNNLNESISKKLVLYPSSKISVVTKCSTFLRIHKALRHTLITTILGIICYSVYFLGTNYDLASKDVAFGTAVGLFGILFVGYWQYVKKESVQAAS